MKITKRLEMTARLVPECDILADIGTDHGYLPIYLLKRGTIKKAIAADLSSVSADKARKSIQEEGLEEYADIRCGNGLSVIKRSDNVNAIVLSGMGGMLVIDILKSNPDVVQNADFLILQPQRHMDRVRDFVHSIGFKITDEDMCIERGKYYFAMRCEKGEDVAYDRGDLLLGRFLPSGRNPLFDDFLSYRIAKTRESIERACSLNPETDVGSLESRLRLLENIYMNMKEKQDNAKM